MPALAALPDIALLVAGVFLFVLAFALYQLRDLLVSGFSHVPGVGSWIASTLGGWLDSAGHAVTRASASAFGGAERLFRAGESWVSNITHRVTLLADEFAGTIWHIAYVQVPGALAEARHYAAVVGNDVRHYAAVIYDTTAHAVAVAYDDARHYTAVAFAAAEHDIAHWYDVARHDTAAALAAAEHDIAHWYDVARHDTAAAYDQAVAHADTAAAGARAYAHDLYTQAELDIQRQVSAAEAMAETSIATAAKGIVTDINHWGDQAINVAWPDAQGGLDALRQALGSAWPELAKLLPYLEGAGAAGLIGALIRSMAGVNVLTKVMTDCVVPNCDNLGSLGKELQQLSSLPAAAAILAWLTFIAADPVAAANDTVTVADPLAGAVFGPLVALISAGAGHL